MSKNVIFRVSIFLLFASAFLRFFYPTLADADLWGHIKFGQDIYETRSITRFDTYSYSSFGAPWINHEWLSELIFYILFKIAGNAGLICLRHAIVIGILWLVWLVVNRATKSMFLKLLFIIVLMNGIASGFAIRPQIFTYFFFTLLLFLIYRFEEAADRRFLYPIPLFMLLWCNLHGGFVAGIGVILFYALSKIISGRLKKEIILLAACSIIATMVNPYGIKLWLFLGRSLSMSRSPITEWQIVSAEFKFLSYFFMVLLTVIAFVFSRQKKSFYITGILLIAFIFSFLHYRHTVLFCILAAVYIPGHIDSILGQRLIILEQGVSRQFLAVVFIVVSVFYISMYFPGLAARNFPLNPAEILVDEDEYPVNAVKFMKDNKIGGNIFCWFNWGELCISGLSPAAKVFIDGRYETVYNDDLIENYFKLVGAQIDYRTYLKHFPETDVMFLESACALSSKIFKDKEWVPVYLTDEAVIFLKKNERNAHLWGQFKNHKLIYEQHAQKFSKFK